jgi:hypothetical protein
MTADEVKAIMLDFAQMLMNAYPDKNASQISLKDVRDVIEIWFEKYIKECL